MSREDHCARCGYLVEYHDVARRCPGMKTGVWTERDPIDGALWPEILARDVAARMRALEEVGATETIDLLRPIVVARPPRSAAEFAGRRAVGLGRLAASLGFDVAPCYWRSGRNVEGCAVKGFRPTLAFVATWERRPGAVWKTDVVYVWNPGDRALPTKTNITNLEELIRA